MPVALQFKNATSDTVIRVWNTFSGQSFTASIPFTADTVIFDPDCQLISRYSPSGGIAERSGRYNLLIFPNPANDQVTVSFSLDSPELISLDLLNPEGDQLEILTTETTSPGNYSKSFNISEPPGIYLVRLKVAGKEYYRKLIVADQTYDR
jgi:WD40 repeat protein